MSLQAIIEAAFERRAEITPKTVDAATRAAIEEVIEGLDNGTYRVAEKIDGEWVTHQWLKKAVEREGAFRSFLRYLETLLLYRIRR